MEYPFKDLLPQDEVTARAGYYRDWSHIDADTFHQISELAKFIREKGYGADTREAIAQALERVYHDAAMSGNANMEVSMARKNFKDLASRLDAGDQATLNALNEANRKIDNASGAVTMDNLTQEIKTAMTGGSVAVVGEGAVGSINVVNHSLPTTKLAVKGYLPKSLTYSLTDSDTRAESVDFHADSGTRIISTSSDVMFQVNLLTDSGQTPIHQSWVDEVTIAKDGNYMIRTKANSTDSLTKSHLELFSINILIFDDDVAVRKKDLKHVLPTHIFFENGAISNTGADDNTTIASTRLRSQNINLSAGDKISLTDTNLEMAIAIVGGSGYVDGWRSVVYEATEQITVRLMLRRKDNEDINPAEGNNGVVFESGQSPATRKDLRELQNNQVKHVTLTGSDDNSGDNFDNGYATLQHALDSGAKTIYVQAGNYHNQAVNATVKGVNILVTGGVEGNNKAIFTGADTINNWSEFEGIYRASYSGNKRFNDVFISKTLPVETTGLRPTYNAVLWEGNNLEDDYKMKPVLTIDECKSEKGTFYYDGTHVYVNAENINAEFNAVRLDNGINITGDNVKMVGIVSDFVTNMPMNLHNVSHLQAINCGALHSSSADGFGLNNTYGKLMNCVGAKNRNDGFNNHYTGNIVLENCSGINNYDDGASPHEDCKLTIYGGEFRGNGKGGVSTASNGKAYVYNAKLIGNRYGLYNSGGEIHSSNNLIKDNETALLHTGEVFISISDVYVNNTTELAVGSTPVETY